jgi:hypothetical protein
MYRTTGERIMILGKFTALLSVHESDNAKSPKRQGSKFAWHSSEHSVFAIKNLSFSLSHSHH